jgi:hypothetical protein
MQTHLPGCYRGPVSCTRDWWPESELDIIDTTPDRSDVPDVNDSDIRADLVCRVRREIAAGTYDTPEKWELALDRLLRRLEQE